MSAARNNIDDDTYHKWSSIVTLVVQNFNLWQSPTQSELLHVQALNEQVLYRYDNLAALNLMLEWTAIDQSWRAPSKHIYYTGAPVLTRHLYAYYHMQ